MTTWTKFSERLPDESVDAVHVQVSPTRSVVWKRVDTPNATWKDYAGSVELWHPITYPDLPQRDETQEERDYAAFTNFHITTPCQIRDMGIRERTARLEGWIGALKYERAEVSKLLENINPGYYEGTAERRELLGKLRKRCGLDK